MNDRTGAFPTGSAGFALGPDSVWCPGDSLWAPSLTLPRCGRGRGLVAGTVIELCQDRLGFGQQGVPDADVLVEGGSGSLPRLQGGIWKEREAG